MHLNTISSKKIVLPFGLCNCATRGYSLVLKLKLSGDLTNKTNYDLFHNIP